MLPLEGEMATSALGTAVPSLNNDVNNHPLTSVNNLEPCNLCFWRVPQSLGGVPQLGTLNL